MSITLKPCPNCGSTDVDYFYYDDEVSVYCKSCQFKMTPHRVEKFAAESWNSLPRHHLHWTTETPTEPGWYWWRRCDKVVRSMVYVTRESVLRPAPRGNWIVLFPHGKEMDATELGGQWAGPIPEPKESAQ